MFDSKLAHFINWLITKIFGQKFFTACPGAYAKRMPMFKSAANAFQFPCPEPFKSLYCFNQGQCFARYDNDQQQSAEARSNYQRQYRYSNGDAAGNSVLDDNLAAIEQQQYRPTSSFTPFCQCAPNYHGRRCELLYDSDLYGYQFADQDERLYARTHKSSPGSEHHGHVDAASAAIDQVQYESFIMPLLLVLLLVSLLALLCCVIYCRRRRKRRQERELRTKLPVIIERF